MRVVFLIPAGQTRSGAPELATYKGRMLVATTAEETREVPRSWIGLDVDTLEVITVTEWKATLTGEDPA